MMKIDLDDERSMKGMNELVHEWMNESECMIEFR